MPRVGKQQVSWQFSGNRCAWQGMAGCLSVRRRQHPHSTAQGQLQHAGCRQASRQGPPSYPCSSRWASHGHHTNASPSQCKALWWRVDHPLAASLVSAAEGTLWAVSMQAMPGEVTAPLLSPLTPPAWLAGPQPTVHPIIHPFVYQPHTFPLPTSITPPSVPQ
jgi:hypothetical protein